MHNRLILIKHSMPQIDPAHDAREWHLSESGRESSLRLAEHLRPYAPTRMLTSDEPKAAETGRIVAEALEIPVEMRPGLHEHDRRGVQFMDDPVAWQALVRRFFAEPQTLVFGNETAHDACQRFAHSVQRLLNDYAEGTLAIATHGTVMALFVAQVARVDGFELWSRLKLPSFVVLNDDLQLVEVVESVSGD